MKLTNRSFQVAITFYGPVHLIFVILPTFLNKFNVAGFLMTGEELLELFTPTAIFAVYLTIFFFARQFKKSFLIDLLFLVGSMLWLQGFVMNHTANYLANTLKSTISEQAYFIIYFYDEIFSHLLNSTGYFIIFSIFAYLSQFLNKDNFRRFYGGTSSALLTGLIMFLVAIESQTVAIYLTLSLSTLGYLLLQLRNKLLNGSLSSFVAITSFTTLLLILSWGLYFGGFPEFSELGII